MSKFLVQSTVRKYCNERGRRFGKEFSDVVEEFIRRKLNAACQVHNGNKKTLDATVAGHVGLA